MVDDSAQDPEPMTTDVFIGEGEGVCYADNDPEEMYDTDIDSEQEENDYDHESEYLGSFGAVPEKLELEEVGNPSDSPPGLENEDLGSLGAVPEELELEEIGNPSDHPPGQEIEDLGSFRTGSSDPLLDHPPENLTPETQEDDTEPSTSTGESFSELDDEDPIRPPFVSSSSERIRQPSFIPRRSKRVRQPRKILTYDKKGEPKIKRYPSHFFVEARIAPNVGGVSPNP